MTGVSDLPDDELLVIGDGRPGRQRELVRFEADTQRTPSAKIGALWLGNDATAWAALRRLRCGLWGGSNGALVVDFWAEHGHPRR
jgi:hypothetical protein